MNSRKIKAAGKKLAKVPRIVLRGGEYLRCLEAGMDMAGGMTVIKALKKNHVAYPTFVREARGAGIDYATGKFYPPGMLKELLNRPINVKILLDFISHDEYSAAHKIISPQLAKRDIVEEQNKRSKGKDRLGFRARLEIATFLLERKNKMATFREIVSHLEKKGFTKPSPIASVSVGELRELGAVIDVVPKTFAIAPHSKWME